MTAETSHSETCLPRDVVVDRRAGARHQGRTRLARERRWRAAHRGRGQYRNGHRAGRERDAANDDPGPRGRDRAADGCDGCDGSSRHVDRSGRRFARGAGACEAEHVAGQTTGAIQLRIE